MDINHYLHKPITGILTNYKKPLLFIVSLLLVSVSAPSWSDDDASLGVPGVRGGVVTTSEPNAAHVAPRSCARGAMPSMPRQPCNSL